MKAVKIGVIPFVLVSATIVVLLSASAVVAAPALHTSHQVSTAAKSQPFSGKQHSLAAVAAISSNDVWAVGDTITQNGASIPLTEHWDGTQWSIINSPIPAGISSAFAGVTAVSTNDVWAVGYIKTKNYHSMPLTERWDGAQWSIVHSPNGKHGGGALYGVSAIASNDIWAVGVQSGRYNVTTLAEHWNGRKWSIVPKPPAYGEQGTAVTTINASDVWMAGYGSGEMNFTLAEHWNGKQWTVVPTPNRGTRYASNSLLGVAAISHKDVWAVGNSSVNHGNKQPSLVEHWDGAQWSIVNSPNPKGSTSSSFSGVTALSASEVWAVGNTVNPDYQTLIERWDGRKWSIVPSPNVQAAINLLTAVSAISVTDVWAVGYTETNNKQALIEHWDGTQWSIIKSPS